MITLTLPVPLARFMPGPTPNTVKPLSVLLNAANWVELAGEIRNRFPLLAERVLTDSGALAPGFVLVVNDRAIPAHRADSYEVRDGDQVVVISALAGG
jgi:sulfur carrier protein ThiS